jgi:energy-coupling factor transport system ATP-binding protein
LAEPGGLRVAAEGLAFTYPDGTRALAGVDLEVGPGERVAIIGQNGSGKSTLVRHFNGLLRPSSGRVVVGDRPVGERHVAELARAVGIVFQNPDRQIFAGNVRAEVAFGPRNLGYAGSALEERIGDALDAVGLSGQDATNPYDLGYSRRKLLGIASVLAMGTPVVVLDEPTTGQDARGVARVQTITNDLTAAGRTVIAISHDMRFVAETFARVVVMEAGRVTLDGTPADVFAAVNWDTLAETYVEPPLAARTGARLGLGSTPTDAALIEAIVDRNGAAGRGA